MKTLKLFVAASLLSALCVQGFAHERRYPGETIYNALPDKAAVFKTGAEWMPFPAYEDRAAWDKLSAGYKANIIKRGEIALKYKWQVITASEFLECQKDGDRKHLEIDRQTKGAIAALALAEMVEGKGRFIPHLIDGMFYESERATWQYAVHTNKQPSRKPLPDPADRYITNGAAHTAHIMATAWYLLHKEFDKIDPVISKTILSAIDRNILEPFLDESKDGTTSHFWMGKDWDKNGGQVANWTTHCTTQIMYCFLLCEKDQQRMLKGIEKGIKLIDNYMDSMPLDGSCDEGPSYWSMAAGRLFEFAQFMYAASEGKFNLFNDDQLRRLCEYKSKIFIADGWEVNFADGEPRSGANVPLLFNMGVSLDSKEMKDFALYKLGYGRKKSFSLPKPSVSDPMSVLFSMLNYPLLKEYEAQALENAGGDFNKAMEGFRSYVGSEWYPENQVAVLRGNDGWFLAAKGGTNGERHNHNDVGSGIVFYDKYPILIDLGCSTYRKETFGKMRYTLLENISAGHNTVTVNGLDQGTGKKFAASKSSCDLKAGKFVTEFAGAYPKEAACKSWTRSWQLTPSGVTIEDSYELTARKAPDDIHFVTNGTATVAGRYVKIHCRDLKGESFIDVKLSIPKGLKAEIIPVENLDKRHVKNWGDKVCRIVLKSSDKAPLKGSYKIEISKD